jgi:glycosyltransferase involved in cell wall biosynthesis
MKILILTSYFPSFDIQYADPRTKFLYYYAVEWVKQGCKVLVLHSIPKYPRFFSQMVYLLEKRLGFNKLQLRRFWQKREAVQAANYQVDGVKVIRTSISKSVPHRDFFSWTLSRHKKKVVNLLKESGFEADIIISDFLTPSAYIANDIKQHYHTPFYQVLHNVDFYYLKKYKAVLRKVLDQASGILFRSYPQAQLFKREGFVTPYEDYILSGIPHDTVTGNVRTCIKKLLFVGSLRITKNVHIVLQAIAASQSRKHYEIEIVGDGPYTEALKVLTNEMGLIEQVVFSGRLSREKVFEKMRTSDCLVMVSKETFGMVYIEALSQGCIVIAAKNQGVDGIVVHGENGFLVELGDAKALAELFDQLVLLDQQDIRRISSNAIQTALKMKDDELAKNLLKRLTAHIQHRKEPNSGVPIE